MNNIYIGILLFILCIQCTPSRKEFDEVLVCEQFYELNKDNQFDFFKNKSILTRRMYYSYDNSTKRFNITSPVMELFISKDSVLLPTYRENAQISEKKVFFMRCNAATLEYISNKYHVFNNKELFNAYQVEVDSIYAECSKIIVPQELPTNNIPICGLHKGYIKFILLDRKEEPKKNIHCYLVIDTLDEYDKRIISEATKINNSDHWYYRINK